MNHDCKHNLSIYLQPPFVLCVLVLALTGVAMSVGMKAFRIYTQKEPCPLENPLHQLVESELGTFKIIEQRTINNAEILESLGTEDYLQLILEDTDLSTPPEARRLLLFITYYQLPDRVPHVPEECYTGGGYQRLRTDNITFHVRNDSGYSRDVPGRYLVFASIAPGLLQRLQEFPVLYFFRVNGRYAGNREAARRALNRNLFSKYAYFSKVELVFNQTGRTPTKQQALAVSEKLLAVILPLLEQNHWPDLRRLNQNNVTACPPRSTVTDAFTSPDCSSECSRP